VNPQRAYNTLIAAVNELMCALVYSSTGDFEITPSVHARMVAALERFNRIYDAPRR
jgi:hypothetical protein